MNCKQCGAEVNASAAFCQACGASLAQTMPEANAADLKLVAGMGRDSEDSEHILWQGRFSHRAMIGGWLLAATITFAVLIIAIASSLSGFGWVLAIAAIGAAWLGMLLRLIYRQMSLHYMLTNQRLIHERGILWRRTDRIEAIDIDDVQFHQGPIGRLVGVGTIHVISSDQSTPQFDLVGIDGVGRVASLIDDVRRKERHKRALHIESL